MPGLTEFSNFPGRVGSLLKRVGSAWAVARAGIAFAAGLAALSVGAADNADSVVVTVDFGTEGVVGAHTRLVVVDGKPAMAHYSSGESGLQFTRNSEAGGSGTWTTVVVDFEGSVGMFLSLAVVDGRPAISYYDNTNGGLKYVRASDASGTTWGTPVTVDASGNVGQYTSLAVIDGKPAIGYYDVANGDLKYVRASEASGTTWGTPVTVDATGDVGQYTSLAVVEGQPAIGYYDVTNGDLKYVRASEASGTTWGTPVAVASTGNVGQYTSLAVVEGQPAISYCDVTNDDLKYVRASDASGTNWGAPVTADATGDVGQYTSLVVIDGHPAISYFDNTNSDLKYVRAGEASGTSWGAPVTVEATGTVGFHASLAVIDGKPAIGYHDSGNGTLKYVRASEATGATWGQARVADAGSHAGITGTHTSLAVIEGQPAISYYDTGNGDLKYVRASNASGTTWGTPVTVASTGNVGQYTSLALVEGQPAISYYDVTNGDLKYVRASDASGTAWGMPVTVDATGNVGSYTSLAVVEGRPAIGYYDDTNDDLKYVRATNASGTSWGTPVTVASTGAVGQYASLAVVDGRPAIGYYDDTNDDLKYVRASNASGTTWGTPVTLDATGTVGQYASLAMVDGQPAISYYDSTNTDLKYVRAGDATGTSWVTPVTLDATGGVGSYTSLATIGGKPAISYYDIINADLKYVRASDATGTSWETPVTLDTTGGVGSHTSLAEVNGAASVAYCASSEGNLKFAGYGEAASAPAVSGATAPADGSYGVGQTLTVAVTFSEAVTVTGTPRLALTIGTRTVYALYDAANSTSTVLVFTYAVQADDLDLDGIAVSSPIDLNGGTLVGTAGGVEATLAFTAPVTTGVLLDGVAPTVSAVVRHTPFEASTAAGRLVFRVGFSERVSGIDPGDFVLTATGTAAGTIESVTDAAGPIAYVAVKDVAGVGTLRLDLAPGATITDLAGNGLNAAVHAAGQTYALVSSSAAVTWGLGRNGELGHGASPASQAYPVAVDTSGGLAGKQVVALATGGSSDDSTVSRYSLALTREGAVYAWGGNPTGVLGNGTTTGSDVPVAVDMTGALAGKTVMAVVAGGMHSLALATDGTVYAWGTNVNGQLGNGSTTDSLTPVAVDTSGALAGKQVVAIAAGYAHSLALASDGTIYAWGQNANGELGDASTTDRATPVAVSTAGVLAGKTLVALSAGGGHSLALAADGTVYAWGLNDVGQLGNGENSGGASSVPSAVSTANGVSALYGRFVVAIVSGYTHNLALDSAGQVYAWGNNVTGRLGTGLEDPSSVPVAVATNGALAGRTIVDLSAAAFSSFALDSEGQVYAWGSNARGLLGTGDTSATHSLVPVPVAQSDVDSALRGRRVLALPPGHLAGHSGVLAYSEAPAITSVTIADGTYRVGDTLVFTVNYSAPVTVTSELTAPLLPFSLSAGSLQYARYSAAGSTSTALTYTYTVAAGDLDLDGIAVSSPLNGSGTTIVGTASGVAATLAFTPPVTTGVRLDTRPILVSLTPADDATEVSPTSELVLAFSANVAAVSGKHLTIKRSADDATVATIAATDKTQVSVSGATVTVHPATTLRYNTGYYMQVDPGAFIDASATAGDGEPLPFVGLTDTTGYSFTTELRREVTVADSADFADYFASEYVTRINLNAGTTYTFPGGTVTRALTISGAGAVIQAGAGLTGDVIRTDELTVVSTYGLNNYIGVKVFLVVEGPGSVLTLDHVTIQNNGADALVHPFFAAINVKTGGSLVADYLELRDFHNNSTPGTNSAYGVHAEPGAVATTVTHSVFGASNAFRAAIATRKGAVTIEDNTFAGTDHPERLRNDDGYEYALYIYGGTGSVKRNVGTGFDSTVQPGYTSGGVAVIGFYPLDLTIEGNQMDANTSGIDVVGTWSPSSSNRAVKINGIDLDAATPASAFVIGEALRLANTAESVSVAFDQNDEVAIPPSNGWTVLGGYRSPFLTVSEVTPLSAKFTFPSALADLDIVSAASAVALEYQKDTDTAWTEVTPTPTLTDHAVTLTLEADRVYRFRARLTHLTTTDANDTLSRVVTTYSTPVTMDTAAPTLIGKLPADDATGVAPDTTFALTFDTNVMAVAGKRIAIKRSGDDAIVATIDAADTTQVSVSGATVTVDPTVTLRYSTGYYLQIEAGAFVDEANRGMVGLTDTTSYSFTTELRREVTVADSAAFADYFTNEKVSTINLNAGTTYLFPGGTVTRALTIQGAARTAVLQAGVGVTDDVIRTGTADGITLSGLDDYTGVKVFLSVTGSLTLKDVTLQNNGTDAANTGFFAIVNVKNGGSLVADGVAVKDFHNNPTPGTNLAFGFHSEPTAVKLAVTNCVFDSSNALRNVIAARGGAITITDNTFTGTAHPERLRNSDGYEYAIYLYGGWGDDGDPSTRHDAGVVENNTISNFVATTQNGYSSGAITLIGFYNARFTIRNNVLSGNSNEVDVTREWQPWSSPSPTVTINELPLTSAEDAFALGEQLRTVNNTGKVTVSLNQGEVVDLGTAPNAYQAVFGGYRSPFLTVGTVTATLVRVTFPTGTAYLDMYAAASSITLEALRDDASAWTTVWTNPGGAPTEVTVPLEQGHTYQLRARFTHLSVIPSTPVTYTGSVSFTTPSYHSADTSHDWQIGLLELTRVIQLYNTTSGTTRTGAYRTTTTNSEDGYEPGVGAILSYHSADTNRDGQISLLELTRVIQLYNTTSGTTRTGAYRLQSGTEDGYAPGSEI